MKRRLKGWRPGLVHAALDALLPFGGGYIFMCNLCGFLVKHPKDWGACRRDGCPTRPLMSTRGSDHGASEGC